MFWAKMGWEKWIKQRVNRLLRGSIEVFYIFTITLLSLLLPLSFLLLSRLSSVEHLLTLHPHPPKLPSFLLTIFLYTSPTLLHILVSFVGITALFHGLMGRITLPKRGIGQPWLYIAWLLLCTLQVCVGLSIEGTIAAGIWKVEYDVEHERTFVTRIIFFLGLYETMIHWSRMLVRPIVDDTLFGVVREEKWIERVVMGSSFGALWWWRIRDEVEGLLIVVEAKLSAGLTIGDLFNWWLYYLIVTIGMVRIVRWVIWVGKVFLCRNVQPSHGCSHGNDDKV